MAMDTEFKAMQSFRNALRKMNASERINFLRWVAGHIDGLQAEAERENVMEKNQGEGEVVTQ